MIRSAIALSALAALLGGCPPPPPPVEDAGADAGLQLSAVEMCSRISAARCELLARCYPAFLRQTPAACRAEEEARCFAQYEALKRSIEGGKTEIDSEKVLSCEQRMKTSFCAPTFPPGYRAAAVPFADCELGTGLLRGKVPSGATCAAQQECAAGSACIKPGGVCLGTCSSTSKEGEPCGFGCSPGLYCETQDTSDPTDDRCAQPKGLNASCTSSRQCHADLHCRAASCRPRGKAGEACSFDPDRLSTCDPGLACDVTPFVANQTGACVRPLELGQSCHFHWSCASNLVCFDLDFTGFPKVAPSAGVCQRPGPPGGNCPYTPYASYVGDQCIPGTYCSSATRKCEAAPALGESCAPSSQSCEGVDVFCKPSGSGDTGTCARAPNIGEECAFKVDDGRTVSIPCSSGWCDDEGTLRCLEANKQIGELCRSDGECRSNRCAVQQDRTLKCAQECL
ncbi:MAG: hypothetical protein HYZ28_07685 [Myxococcales bacterium]|nr:hypothetical protein [Myxococcales bacterium]